MKFMPGGGKMGNMMKEAMKIQQEIGRLQAELKEKVMESSSGGGAVSIKINGKQEILELKIKPEAVDPEDVEMLEDLIMTAVNEAIKKSQDMVSGEMSKITGGMNIPGIS